MAYLPRTAMVHLVVRYVLQDVGDSFRTYFIKHCCKEQKVEGNTWHLPMFYCGAGSAASRAGHPASQNLAELSIKLLKEVVRKKPKSEIELLEKLERRYSLATQCETAEHGFLGPSQECSLTPLSPSCSSPDIRSGEGRPYKSMNEQRWWPSAKMILDAHKHTGASLIQVGKYHILRRFWQGRGKYTVSAAQAADLARHMSARTYEELRGAWLRTGVLSEESGVAKLNHSKLTEFYWDPRSYVSLFATPSS